MSFDFKGKTAFVTGGNVGIGRDIVRALASYGASVALTCYSHDDDTTVNEVREAGGIVEKYQLDATDSAEVNDVFARATEFLGGHVDILVNNAGGLISRVMIADMPDEHWRRVLDVNLTSAFYCSRAALAVMPSDSGRIINIGSVASFNGGGGGSTAYATAKAAMIGFTRGLAKEVGGRRITVNTVAPGMILETPFHDTFSTPEAIKGMMSRTPVGRVGVPSDVTGAVLFLASEMASFITGEVIIVNGGSYFA